MRKSIIFSMFIGGLLYSCTGEKKAVEQVIENQKNITKDVTKEEFKSLSSEKDGYILDVRTPQECAGGMIDGAQNIDYMSADFGDQVANLDKSKPVFVYCAAGGRSAQAMQDLSNMGFKEVYNLLGGYSGWSNK